MREANESGERLYNLSSNKQREGQERRERIAMSRKKKRPTTKKISLERATGIYERGMLLKMNLEMKREDEGHTPYVSPFLNPLVVDEVDDLSSFYSMSRSRSGSVQASVSRGRSQTPIGMRRGRPTLPRVAFGAVDP